MSERRRIERDGHTGIPQAPEQRPHAIVRAPAWLQQHLEFILVTIDERTVPLERGRLEQRLRGMPDDDDRAIVATLDDRTDPAPGARHHGAHVSLPKWRARITANPGIRARAP
ncbi:hypothetical protein BLA6860_07802 [Burkholderia lata]|uniref:Uncharacterized protein n=1 Tax=Burkholderia lata (strain ATCC 17760 / DSM 23089 / LMG 22485 / NCIMB 9086 / R18194 / 383) TaxID=482957 RepID=A0A6P2T3G6_BURL3|nr:hypothetical protein BLA6860_07802 [Burkholderia lata]VWC51856.1 hypothetical protein BLA6863_07994 [Burkholderia lata]